MEAGQGANSLNRCILMFGECFGGRAPSGRGRKKYAKLEVGLAGRAVDADGGRGRDQRLVYYREGTHDGLFDFQRDDSDRGTLDIRCPRFKLFLNIFRCNLPQVTVILRCWAGLGTGRQASGRRMFGRKAKQTSMVLNRPPVRRSMSKNLPPPKGRWRIGRAESHE